LLALDTRLDRKVAIKRILGEAARSKTAVSRFLTEAKAIAALNHPNVVQIYDYGRAADGPFLIMEYVDGSSLLDRCRDGALPLEQAVDLACQLCDGLAKAHDRGIVHRDIKPANVLLTKDGLPKLTDFGLAKAEAADHQMTMTGAVLGTPDFMPPEQRKDAALVDHRSDLWSLAATLYQMVTGRSPKIIRFDLLPPGLTSVLGKALEDGKDDRYQSAREFRDALKTSLVASAPAAAELGEGQCPACGVRNDSSRRFCRGCGESLEAPCLSCSKPMPMWEHICGQCGTKQPPLLEDRRGEMAARQAEAEGLLKDYDFDQAERLTVSLRDESDPRLKQFVPWATDFVAKIDKAREAQLAQAGARLAEALKHEASFDYPSAIHALEQVPGILRSRSLVGQAESVADALSRVTAKQSNVEKLESLVKARIASRDLSRLLPEVEKLRDLRPDRADVEKLCAQLVEREQKLAAQRDEAVRLAQGHLDAKDYESAIAVLRKVDRSFETPDVKQLRDAAELSIRSLQNFLREISQAVAQKQFDGLVTKVQAALALKPGHAELTKLLDGLQVRESKVAASIQEILTQADTAFKACQFAKAAALLQRVPEDRRNSEVTDLLDRCEYLAMTRAGVLAGFEELSKITDLAMADGVNLTALAVQGRSYLGQIAAHSLSELLIEQWCVRCETAHEKREAAAEEARRARDNLRKLFIGTGAAAAAILLMAGGLWVRSSWRAASVRAALAKADWQAALTIAPSNVEAIIGLAKEKLAAKPPDIAGAFADLDRVEKINRAAPELNLVRAAAHTVSSIEHAVNRRLREAIKDLEMASQLVSDDGLLKPARLALATAWQAQAVEDAQADRLDDAGKALAQAARFTDDDSVLKPATDALIRAWLVRAEAIAGMNDIDALKRACDAAVKAGCKPGQLSALWITVAKRSAAAQDHDAMAAACAEGEHLGLTKEMIAGLWVDYGSKATEPPHRNRQAAEAALKEAVAAGAASSSTESLRAKIALIEAHDLLSKDAVDAAVAKYVEASLADANTVRASLPQTADANFPIATMVAFSQRCDSELHKRFAAATKAGEWALALKTAAAARICFADKSEASWVEVGIARLPAEAITALSPSLIADLPASVILAMPPIRNSLGMQLKLIPPGRFSRSRPMRGSQPQDVILSQAFYIGVHEVTNAQWKKVMGDVPSKWKDDDLPVEGISWIQAVEFCQRLSMLLKEKAKGNEYRLPTEAEWEYASRAGTSTAFSFGSFEDVTKEIYEEEISKHGWDTLNSDNRTHHVGRKLPNGWGLYDMNGNVFEWCSDWISGLTDRVVTDPRGPASGESRVIRGGSWSQHYEKWQVEWRIGAPPAATGPDLGCRLVLIPATPLASDADTAAGPEGR
jgi:serine/threonine protein kinase/formylglycine-generating enzyme required for sulfatase activity